MALRLRARLLRFYLKIETVWYKVLDALHRWRIPVYAYFVKPVERLGIPSFLFFLFFIFLIGGLFYWFLGSLRTASLQVQVQTNSIPVKDAVVELSWPGEVLNATTNEAGVAIFTQLPLAQEALLKVSKPGFSTFQRRVTLGLFSELRVVITKV